VSGLAAPEPSTEVAVSQASSISLSCWGNKKMQGETKKKGVLFSGEPEEKEKRSVIIIRRTPVFPFFFLNLLNIVVPPHYCGPVTWWRESFEQMLNEEQLESNFGEGWRVREELFREKIEELTEAEIKANIQFNEASDLLVLVKNTRTHNDHAAFRILQRHLEELYLLKHILYERGFYLYNTTNAGQATNTPNLHVRCEAKTTKNLPE